MRRPRAGHLAPRTTPRLRRPAPAAAQALSVLAERLLPGGRVVSVGRLRGGVSSSMQVVRLVGPDGQARDVVVRRYGEFRRRVEPDACQREWRLLQVLDERGRVRVPRPLLLDLDGSLLGGPALVMSRLPGRGFLAPRQLDAYLDQLARALASVHATPVAGLEFVPPQAPEIARLVHDTPVRTPLEARVQTALLAWWPRVADGAAVSLVHGDYWPGNVLWQRERLTGVVDWEQPRLGDPTHDVGVCRGDLAMLFGLDAADAFAEAYAAAVGGLLRHLFFWDLVTTFWAARYADTYWLRGYRDLGRTDLSPDVVRQRLELFAERALRQAQA